MRGVFIFFNGFMLLLALVSMSVFTQMHELAHKINCEYRGGEATVSLRWVGLVGGETSCSVHSSEMVNADVLIDVVGYHLSTFLLSFFAVAILLGDMLIMLRVVS